MLNACAAELRDYGRLIMNDEDVDSATRLLYFDLNDIMK